MNIQQLAAEKAKEKSEELFTPFDMGKAKELIDYKHGQAYNTMIPYIKQIYLKCWQDCTEFVLNHLAGSEGDVIEVFDYEYFSDLVSSCVDADGCIDIDGKQYSYKSLIDKIVSYTATHCAKVLSQQWVSVETPPECFSKEVGKRSVRAVWCYTNAKGTRVGYYFPDKFKELDVSDWDGFNSEDYSYIIEDVERGICWLKEGWYEEVYNYVDDYYFWQPIAPTHWQHLPTAPLPTPPINQ